MENTQKTPTKTIIVVIIILVAAILIYRAVKQNDTSETVQKSKIEKIQSTISSTPDSAGVYDVIEKMPEYPGGEQALIEFLSNNIKYPVTAQDKGIQGRVIIGFIIDKEGKVKQATVLRGVDAELDKEALRVVNLLENWVPGEQKGEKVSVRYTLPISFRLQ